MMNNKDAFDLWWEWTDKPVDSTLTIDAAIHDAVMALPPTARPRETFGSHRQRRSPDRLRKPWSAWFA